MKRYKYLDAARGIGLMLVIISHSCGLNLYLIYYYIPLFFLISGYIYKEGKSYGNNIGRKAKRLLIPYFGYSAFLLGFYTLTGRGVSETISSAFGIFYSRYCLYDTTGRTENIYLFTVANGAMWYLTAFFTASLVYHLVIDRCLINRKYLIGCMVLLTVISMALAELPLLLPWSIDIACAGTMFMIMGTLLGRAEFFERKWNSLFIIGVFAAYMAIATINPGINMSIREYGKYGFLSVPLFMLVGLSGSILCIWVAKMIQENMLGRFLSVIGKNTIPLLALHILGLEVFEKIAGKIIEPWALSGVPFIMYHVVRIAVSVGGCLVLAKVLEYVKQIYFRKIRGEDN